MSWSFGSISSLAWEEELSGGLAIELFPSNCGILVREGGRWVEELVLLQRGEERGGDEV